jgi:hypothetical protein
MGRPSPTNPVELADLFVGWHLQAAIGHELVSRITRAAGRVEDPGDGYVTVTVRVPADVWADALAEAERPPPEAAPRRAG